MRSSSIKSLVITAAAVATLTLTAVPVSARPAQSTQPVASAPQQRDGSIIAKIKRLSHRFAGVLLHGSMGTPIPAPVDGSTESTAPSSSND